MRCFFVLAFYCSLLISCDKQNKNNDINAIRQLLQQERKAHLDRDVDLFLSEFAPGIYSINRGVFLNCQKRNSGKIQAYFNAVKFIKWDDVPEPVIKFSDDHSLAYAIVQKQLILEKKDSAGKIETDTTDFAWTSIYRKHKNEWKIECNISTNK